MKGHYGEAEYTGDAISLDSLDLSDTGTPTGWPKKPVFSPPGGPPGPPIQWGDDITNDNADLGFGYIGGGLEEQDAYYYHSDHLGSTSYLTDLKGNVRQYTAYMPYGESFVSEHTTSTELPYKFNGKPLDEETGLYYYGARYYDPSTAVWSGVDPLAGKYPNMGSYVYCNSNPIKYIDPDGRQTNPTEYAYLAISLGKTGFKFRPDNMKLFRKNVNAIYSHSGGANELANNIANTVGYTTSTGPEALIRGYSTPDDPITTTPNKEIMFMAIFSHGVQGSIWGDGDFISGSDLDVFEQMIADGKIAFHQDALIYLGACNAGTGGENSFAQDLANATGASVIGMMDDGVAPTGNEGTDTTMTYGPKMGKANGGNFYKFQKGQVPELVGKEADVIQLLDQQKQKED